MSRLPCDMIIMQTIEKTLQTDAALHSPMPLPHPPLRRIFLLSLSVTGRVCRFLIFIFTDKEVTAMERTGNCAACIWNKRSECGTDFCIFPACVSPLRKRGSREIPGALTTRGI